MKSDIPLLSVHLTTPTTCPTYRNNYPLDTSRLRICRLSRKLCSKLLDSNIRDECLRWNKKSFHADLVVWSSTDYNRSGRFLSRQSNLTAMFWSDSLVGTMPVIHCISDMLHIVSLLILYKSVSKTWSNVQLGAAMLSQSLSRKQSSSKEA